MERVPPLDVPRELLDGGRARPQRLGERRRRLAEHPLELPRGEADLVEIRRARDPRLLADRLLERERGGLGRLDPRRILDRPHLGQLAPQRREIPPPATSAASSQSATPMRCRARPPGARSGAAASSTTSHSPASPAPNATRYSAPPGDGSAASTPVTSPYADDGGGDPEKIVADAHDQPRHA